MANKRIDQFDTATPEGDEWLLIQDPVTLGYNKASASSLTSATSYTKIEVDTSLAGKAELVHVHAISDVTGLQTALDGKSATGHTHTAANVTDFDAEVSNNTDVAANISARHTHANSAVLDATTASFTTADETKLDGIAAGAQVNTVTSVNTRTGAVTGLAEASDLTAHTGNTSNPHSVTKAQVGLGSVDNTSDASKPISTATQSALNAKQDTLVSGTNIKTINGNSILGSGDMTISGGGGGGSDELRGTGMPNGVVTANPGTYYTDTNGTNGAWRWLKTSGTSNTGWVVTVGDTGKRRIQKDANYAPAMRDIVFQRIGTRVFCEAHYMGQLGTFGVPQTGGPYTVYQVPDGFSSPNFAAAPMYDGGTVAQIGVIYQYASSIGFKVTTASANTDSELSWATADPWPTTLPGTPL